MGLGRALLRSNISSHYARADFYSKPNLIPFLASVMIHELAVKPTHVIKFMEVKTEPVSHYEQVYTPFASSRDSQSRNRPVFIN